MMSFEKQVPRPGKAPNQESLEQPDEVKSQIKTPAPSKKVVEALDARQRDLDEALMRKTSSVDQTQQAPPIPVGWTFLVHGTHLLKPQWNDSFESLLDGGDFTVTGSGLSMVTREKMEANPYGRGKSTASYSRFFGKTDGMDESKIKLRDKPIQIRVVFPKNCTDYGGNQSLKEQIFEGLDEGERTATSSALDRYYWDHHHKGEHPVVPSGDKMIRLANTLEDGVETHWFIPEKLEKLYRQRTSQTQ